MKMSNRLQWPQTTANDYECWLKFSAFFALNDSMLELQNTCFKLAYDIVT